MEKDFRVCPNCNHLLFIAHDGDTYHSDNRLMRLECHNPRCDYQIKMAENEFKKLRGNFNK